MPLIQHKKEAYWFYRFLSVFYDKFVNPLFWTERMRDEALELAQLDRPDLSVIDVGSGTGFTTEGIVQYVKSECVCCLDQSPHQMARARSKSLLQACAFQIGDAENLPFANGQFDRYVSAGSIEYWPDPQKGIEEAFRVLKTGGLALLIGPLQPENSLARFLANTWMLFPRDRQYREWFEKAGFTEIRVKYVRPHWFRKKQKYGIAISGLKAGPGESKNYEQSATKNGAEEKMTPGRSLKLIWRVLIGSIAGFVFIPIALFGYLRNAFGGQKDVPEAYREKLNAYQISALIIILGAISGLIILILL